MSAALELIRKVEANGGQLRVDGEYLVIAPKRAGEPLVDELRQHKSEIIELLHKRPDTSVGSPQDDGWGTWLLERCVFRDRWWGGTGALHLDLARWCIAHGRPVPTSRRAFEAVLQSEGFQVTSDGLVYGLILEADLEAHERFHAAPDPEEAAAPSLSPDATPAVNRLRTNSIWRRRRNGL
jgi:hypothetical protein